MSGHLDELGTSSVVTLSTGEVCKYKPIDGFGQKRIQQMTPETSVETMYWVAARCIGRSMDEVFGSEDKIGFSNADVMAIVAAAGKQIAEVAATIPNDGKADAVKDGEKIPSRPSDSPQPIQLAS